MLNGDFYEIAEQPQAGHMHTPLHFAVRMNAAHAIYKGHFPEQPVTPGACLLQMTQELLSLVAGKKMRLVSVTNLKFVAPHTPENPVCVDFKETGENKYQVTIYDATTVYAKMSEQYMCTDSNV